jgi:WD40 repeat protein
VQRVIIDKTWRGLCFNNDESTLFVSGGNNDKVYLYDFHNGNLKSKDSLNLKIEYDSLISVTGVAYWGSKNYIIAVSRQSNSIYFYDINKKKIVKRIMPGSECFDVIIDHKGLYAYVSLWGGAKIARINLKKLEIDNFIKVGDHP